MGMMMGPDMPVFDQEPAKYVRNFKPFKPGTVVKAIGGTGRDGGGAPRRPGTVSEENKTTDVNKIGSPLPTVASVGRKAYIEATEAEQRAARAEQRREGGANPLITITGAERPFSGRGGKEGHQQERPMDGSELVLNPEWNNWYMRQLSYRPKTKAKDVLTSGGQGRPSNRRRGSSGTVLTDPLGAGTVLGG